ncbi:class I SAM-dependent methyltransferase [Saccharibacillus kuerlensis]|uniref:Methyltransferase type 11 n=1 Tax=Saccharibacillus kuerlensis TaxID=459527 RepID=A0ABQ2L508_9BACL|nr:class I SAM-dependent methyltransferase [Saccharibacillus kuerlensis]GGO01153.1 methyltransferase type 11 [Saccharibacillus kuerlensis]
MGKVGVGQKWDAKHYDEQIGYVSKHGMGLVELLQPQAGERIIDLGCGTGDLSEQIRQVGAYCAGMDYSPEMIEAAREKYPHGYFRVANAEEFRLDPGEQLYDAVFSNAALHWMKRPEAVIESIEKALRPGGRFVAEFGGSGNVGAIVQALTNELDRLGTDWEARFPWYFPSVGQYTPLLEKHGFEVRYAELYDRPTPLGSGGDGLNNWLQAFAGSLLAGIDPQQQAEIVANCASALEPSLYQNGEWIADYRRLRIVAVKK